jgi:hypothetical protein
MCRFGFCYRSMEDRSGSSSPLVLFALTLADREDISH